VRQRDLLAAIADIDPIRVQGTFERHTSLRWEELKPSAAGGRWGARRAYEVLYLGPAAQQRRDRGVPPPRRRRARRHRRARG
jgi:hypothetical protein